MGQNIEAFEGATPDAKQFTQSLLRDLNAFEMMLEKDMIESGVTRIGAEQELCLVNDHWNPAPLSMEVLERLNHKNIVTEFARFNMEINLDPQDFKGDCFQRLERQLRDLLALIAQKAAELRARPVLSGILPTIRVRDLQDENMTPLARYKVLNQNLKMLRGGKPFNIYLDGTDQLICEHDSSLLEACNTSFQVHLQVSPSEFADQYNFAQLVSAPLLAAAANSPLFFGRRLWKETRIALFQQSIDTRHNAYPVRDQSPRVTFGNGWVDESVMDIFRDDISRFRLIIYTGVEENSMETLMNGGIPKLKALNLFNGTVYRWNRACYGLTNGVPHLRIENRVLPSGPTVIDEMANAAFWLGMVHAMPDQFRNLADKLSFDLANANFIRAAKMGLDARFTWLGERTVNAQELIAEELLPIARDGLQKARVDSGDIDRLLGVVQERINRRRTGALWIFESFNRLKTVGTRYEAAVALTASMYHQQQSGKPVHEWELARINDPSVWRNNFLRVEQIMSTDLYTVQEEDLVDLVTHMMRWKYIRHVPVEDNDGRLVGMVNARTLLHYLGSEYKSIKLTAVKEIMIRDPITTTPETLTLDALKVMMTQKISCLPVVVDGKLVGIITENDFTRICLELLAVFADDTEGTELPPAAVDVEPDASKEGETSSAPPG